MMHKGAVYCQCVLAGRLQIWILQRGLQIWILQRGLQIWILQRGHLLSRIQLLGHLKHEAPREVGASGGSQLPHLQPGTTQLLGHLHEAPGEVGVSGGSQPQAQHLDDGGPSGAQLLGSTKL